MTTFREDLLACRDCHVLQPAAEGTPNHHDAVIRDATDAHDVFIAQHAAHRLARFRRHGSRSHADRPLWDPMATLTFEATDGRETYVVTCKRQSIDQPRVYCFAPGSLGVGNAEITIHVGDLRRGLDLRFYPHAIRPTKVDRFLAVLCDLLSHVAADDLEIAFDAPEDPAVSIARMPDAVYSDLLGRCADIFDAWELERVYAFLRDNRDGDGLLTLRVRREVKTLNA